MSLLPTFDRALVSLRAVELPVCRRLGTALVVGLGLGSAGCVPLTREEVAASLEEVKLFSQAAALTGASVDLASEFTIGGAVEDSIENLRAFYASQVPCAAIELDEGTLVVEYGATGSTCTHRGLSFTGRHEISIERVETDRVVVDHFWDELDNGELSVSGAATVTWSAEFGGEVVSRRVAHDLVWTRASDGRTASGAGDRTQVLVGGDEPTGVVVSGEASWQGESGEWVLEIDEVTMRFVDPVPESGNYRLGTPFDEDIAFDFERTSATNVRVTADVGRRDYEFDVATAE